MSQGGEVKSSTEDSTARNTLLLSNVCRQQGTEGHVRGWQAGGPSAARRFCCFHYNVSALPVAVSRSAPLLLSLKISLNAHPSFLVLQHAPPLHPPAAPA